MGQENCYIEENHYVTKKSSCVDNSCVSQITGVVDRCPTNIGCNKDEVCDRGKCVSGRQDTIINPFFGRSDTDSQNNQYSNSNNNTNNFLINTLIIAGAIILGFIILAIILNRKRR